MLKKLGIVKTKNKGYKVFMEHIAPDFLDNSMIPSEYVKFCWKKYETSGVPRTNSLNGTIWQTKLRHSFRESFRRLCLVLS